MKKIILSMAFLTCGASVGMLQGGKVPFPTSWISNFDFRSVHVNEKEMSDNVNKILKMQDVPHDVFLAALQLRQNKKFDKGVLDNAHRYCKEILDYKFKTGKSSKVVVNICSLVREKMNVIASIINEFGEQGNSNNGFGGCFNKFEQCHGELISGLISYVKTECEGLSAILWRNALYAEDIRFLNSPIELLNKLITLEESDKNLLYDKVKSFIDGSVREIIPDIVRSFEKIKSGLSDGTVQLSSMVIDQLKSFEREINGFIRSDKLDVSKKRIMNEFKIEIQELRNLLEKANAQIEEANKKTEEINKRLQESGAENKDLKAQVSKTDAELQAVGVQLSLQGEKLKASEKENEDLKNQVSEKSGELQEVQQKCAELERNIVAFKKEKNDIDIINNQTVVKGMIDTLKNTFNNYWRLLPEGERLDIANCINDYIMRTVDSQSAVVNTENLDNIEVFAPVFKVIPDIGGKFQFFGLLNSLVFNRIAFNLETTRAYSDQRAECDKILKVKNPFAFNGNWETNVGTLIVNTSGGSYYFKMGEGNVSVCSSRGLVTNSSCFWNMNFWNRFLKIGDGLNGKRLGANFFSSEKIMIIGNDNVSNKRLLCVEKDICFVSQFECTQNCACANMTELFIPGGSEVTFCKGDYNGTFTLAEKMSLSEMKGFIEAEVQRQQPQNSPQFQSPLMIKQSNE